MPLRSNDRHAEDCKNNYQREKEEWEHLSELQGKMRSQCRSNEGLRSPICRIEAKTINAMEHG